jgi:metalloendopeptidase OMA1, mitochondrial
MTRPRAHPSHINNNSPIAPDADSLASDNGVSDERKADKDTSSLSPSVTDYPTHWGRRYHRYREGSYVFPNDEIEIERLNNLHEILTDHFDGRLYCAPLEPARCREVLEIGTGTGQWSIDLDDSERLPRATITGIDLSAIQPLYVSPNVQFEIQDCSDRDWARPLGSLDFIFSRMMAGSLASHKNLIRTARRYLRPGSGWLELQEIYPRPQCDDDTMKDDWKFKEWENDIATASKNRLDPPRPTRVAQHLEQWFKDCGFVEIGKSTSKIPLGTWPKDKKLKDIGRRYAENWQAGLSGFSYKLLGADGLGWSRNEIELNLVEVRKSLMMKEVHAYLVYHVVYGRRPNEREERELLARRQRGEDD